MPTRRVLVLALAAVAAAGAAACSAPAFATGGLVDVEIVDRGRNEVLPTYRQRGTSWVAGRPGSRYAVRLRNRCGNRVLVVLSVDGVNAISGETASASQTGYVLAPYQSAEITGWRKSMSEAAAFYFTALPDSYAARTGRPDNVGVIGVAVFRERERERVVEVAPRAFDRAAQAQSATRERGDAAPAAPAAKAEGQLRDERLGTGHGEREYAPITHTAFERASDRPDEIVQLRYDSVENLIALGVLRPTRVPPPEPFPGFVPDPKG
ncbi:MAG TPA: hypothetical protein VNU48_02165 [Burkholderiaceae bacterium]|nr:hypothetical protein [Burkholderiaceae bacterium]